MNITTKNALTGVFIFLFLIAVSSIIILTIDLRLSENIEKILSVSNSLSSLITLLIALVLFNKFGVEQDILQKNLKAVSDVFEILAKTRLTIFTNQGSIHFLTALRDLREGRFSNDEFKNYKDKIVAGDITVIGGLDDLSTLGESIFMPKEVAKCIQKMSVGGIHFSKEISENPEKYVHIQYQGVKNTVYSFELNKEVESKELGLIGGDQLTLSQYLNQFEDLYKECNKWLKKNSSIDLDLNS